MLEDKVNQEGHTCSPLTDLLRHDPKDRDYLDHDLNDDVRHSGRRSDIDVFFKPYEKEFHTAKQIYKSILASAVVFNGLRDMYHVVTRRVGEDAHLKKDADSSKNYICWWKYLSRESEGGSRAGST